MVTVGWKVRGVAIKMWFSWHVTANQVPYTVAQPSKTQYKAAAQRSTAQVSEASTNRHASEVHRLQKHWSTGHTEPVVHCRNVVCLQQSAWIHSPCTASATSCGSQQKCEATTRACQARV